MFNFSARYFRGRLDTEVYTVSDCREGGEVTLWKIVCENHNPALTDDYRHQLVAWFGFPPAPASDPSAPDSADEDDTTPYGRPYLWLGLLFGYATYPAAYLIARRRRLWRKQKLLQQGEWLAAAHEGSRSRSIDTSSRRLVTF